MQKALFPIDYPDEFNAARAAFRPGVNDSKADAFKAYRQTMREREAAGATGGRFVACCAAYDEWLEGENNRRRQGHRSEHPRLHMATFIRQRRWEGFMTQIETISTKTAAQTIGWETEAAILAKELTDEKFSAWFSDVAVSRGNPTELTFSSPFRASYAARAFMHPLRRAFGTCRLAAVGSPEKFDI